MSSTKVKREFNGRTWLVAVLCLAGALAAGIVQGACAREVAPVGPPDNNHNPNGLTVTLHFSRGRGGELSLQGCKAQELEDQEADAQGCTVDQNDHALTATAEITWNGQRGRGGSGCAKVGNTMYCW